MKKLLLIMIVLLSKICFAYDVVKAKQYYETSYTISSDLKLPKIDIVFEIKDRKLLEIAKVIAAEACGEGFDGMVRVANVINNRAKAWHKSHYEIVTQPKQFFGYTARNKNKLYNQCHIEAGTIAYALVTGNLPDYTKRAIVTGKQIGRAHV